MSATVNKTLVLFTSTFPFGKGEQFIETEIEFLSRTFREVHIYPVKRSGVRRPLPVNVTVKDFSLYSAYSRPGMILLKGFKLFRWYREQLKLTRHPEKYKGKFRSHFSFLMHRVADAIRAGEMLKSYDPGSTVLYSYWFNVWTMTLLFAKKLGLHQMHVLTRAHGGDLDEQQRPSGYFPLRSLEMSLIDRVACISEYGRKLLSAQYPSRANIISVSRLGVSEQGNNPYVQQKAVRIVTCSFVYGLKRLHLVGEVLKHLKMEVEWIHFGEGELLEDIKKKAATLPANIHVEFRGLVPNKEVIDYYKCNQVDLFMNVSELEGIPVSIMEAISFGIPVTGCDVCGVPEIVTARTGFLLEKDFDPEKVASTLNDYLNLPFDERVRFREGVKSFWKMNFDAARNYSEFINNYLR